MTLKTKRAENYPAWYQCVVSEADMAENSVSPGCMVIKPWGYGIWERIRDLMDEEFRETDHENAYFPLFIPISFFRKEAEHVVCFNCFNSFSNYDNYFERTIYTPFS